MQRVQFTKMQTVGNDFIVINWEKENLGWNLLSKRLSDRHFGIGADGLIIILPSDVADYRMRMFNPDGTEDMCGNGLRCSVRVFCELKNIDRNDIKIETISGIKKAEIIDKNNWIIRVNLGEPILDPKKIPIFLDFSPIIDYPLVAKDKIFNATIVSTGTTHSVIFYKDLPDEIFKKYSPIIENHPLFPNRTSVIWVVEEDKDELKIRIWERGVGETLGCGTGACASVVAKMLKERENHNYKVTSSGGTLFVEWSNRGDMLLSGKVEKVFEGSICTD
ncbi:MAG: diaminopimelate epimerase [bacterium]|nr:diaminopimelate epimerase [bacterium]